MTTWIVPLLADKGKEVARLPDGQQQDRQVLGPISKRICEAAARLAYTHNGSYLCPATSRRTHEPKDWKLIVSTFLLCKAHIPVDRILPIDTEGLPFRTIGEIHAIARALKAERGRKRYPEGISHTVYLVARWWHVPRAKAMLRKALGGTAQYVDVRGYGIEDHNWFFALFYEPAAWVRNIKHLP